MRMQPYNLCTLLNIQINDNYEVTLTVPWCERAQCLQVTASKQNYQIDWIGQIGNSAGRQTLFSI